MSVRRVGECDCVFRDIPPEATRGTIDEALPYLEMCALHESAARRARAEERAETEREIAEWLRAKLAPGWALPIERGEYRKNLRSG